MFVISYGGDPGKVSSKFNGYRRFGNELCLSFNVSTPLTNICPPTSKEIEIKRQSLFFHNIGKKMKSQVSEVQPTPTDGCLITLEEKSLIDAARDHSRHLNTPLD